MTKRGTLEEQLATAIVFGHVDQVRDLSKAGVNITANEHEAVHLAARHGRADILHVLLDALAPAARADLLADMLSRSPRRARQASAVAAPR